MPTREDADDDDARDAADGGDRGGANSVSRPRVSTAIHHVLQTIVQHAAEAFHDKLKPLSSVLCTLELSGVNWNSNPGVIVAALLRAAGLAWNSTGKKLWRRADPAETIEWRQPAASHGGSLRPAAPRATTLGGIGAAAGLQHDPESGSAASARAQRAAEAARPSAPRALELVAPAAVDRLARGSGWGNVPRPLARCCMAEQSSLDGLQPRRRQLRERVGRRRRRGL